MLTPVGVLSVALEHSRRALYEAPRYPIVPAHPSISNFHILKHERLLWLAVACSLKHEVEARLREHACRTLASHLTTEQALLTILLVAWEITRSHQALLNLQEPLSWCSYSRAARRIRQDAFSR